MPAPADSSPAKTEIYDCPDREVHLEKDEGVLGAGLCSTSPGSQDQASAQFLIVVAWPSVLYFCFFCKGKRKRRRVLIGVVVEEVL